MADDSSISPVPRVGSVIMKASHVALVPDAKTRTWCIHGSISLVAHDGNVILEAIARGLSDCCEREEMLSLGGTHRGLDSSPEWLS